METVVHLTRLKPGCPANFVHPASSRLIGRLVDVAAATQQRLVLSDELQHRRRADLSSISANVHAQRTGRLVNHPDAPFHLSWAKLRFDPLQLLTKGRFCRKIVEQVV